VQFSHNNNLFPNQTFQGSQVQLLLIWLKSLSTMKNILLTLTGACLILFSCKKEESQQALKPSVTAKKYVVKFNVSDFEQSVGAISANSLNKNPSISAAMPLDSCINNLVFLAYDSTGKEVGRIRQINDFRLEGTSSYIAGHDPADPNLAKPYLKPFGTLVDSLPSGKYTVSIAGSKLVSQHTNSLFTINTRKSHDDVEEGYIRNRYPLNTTFIGESYGLAPERFSVTEDTFFESFSINVGSQNIQQEVTLERITGKLEINILDEIPANANRISFKIYDAATGFSLSPFKVGGKTDYMDEGEDSEYPENVPSGLLLKDSDKGKTNYKYTKFLYGADQPVRVKIQCFDASGNMIAIKNIPNVRIYKNKRTILSGKLFGTTQQTGFTVSVNSDWDPATLEVPF